MNTKLDESTTQQEKSRSKLKNKNLKTEEDNDKLTTLLQPALLFYFLLLSK